MEFNRIHEVPCWLGEKHKGKRKKKEEEKTIFYNISTPLPPTGKQVS
jgi:hypothetical protein